MFTILDMAIIIALMCLWVMALVSLRKHKENDLNDANFAKRLDSLEEEIAIVSNKLWQTKKPTAEKICAKISPKFCHHEKHFDVLFKGHSQATYYDAGGEEIPYDAIERWIKL